MDLAQTHTSMANDVAGDGVQNGESHSDVGLIHRGDMINCLLGVACRCWHSAGVPAMMRRVDPRSSWGPGVVAGPGVAEGAIPLKKQAVSIGSSWRV